MSTERVTLAVSIKIDGPDDTEISLALQNAVDSLGFGGGGEGWTKNSTHYKVEITSNLPTKPMTLPALLELIEADEDIRRQVAEHFAALGANPQNHN